MANRFCQAGAGGESGFRIRLFNDGRLTTDVYPDFDTVRRILTLPPRRKGPNASKVATARRLLTIVYRVLTRERPYEEHQRPGMRTWHRALAARPPNGTESSLGARFAKG
jgi:hypothetical protein